MLFLNLILRIYSADMEFFHFKDQILDKKLAEIKNSKEYQKQKLKITKNYNDFYCLLKHSYISITSYSSAYKYREIFEINEDTLLQYILYMISKCNENDSKYVYDLYVDFLTVRIALLDKQKKILKKKNYVYQNLKDDTKLIEMKNEFEKVKFELIQNHIINVFNNIKADFLGTVKHMNSDHCDLFEEEYFNDIKKLYASYVNFLSSLLAANKFF